MKGMWVIMLFLCAGGVHASALRNPFIPQIDPCVAPFHGWWLAGTVGHGYQTIALVVDPDGQWHRLRSGGVIAMDWQVEKITDGYLSVRSLRGCPEFEMKPIVKGNKDGDKKDVQGNAVVAAGPVEQ